MDKKYKFHHDAGHGWLQVHIMDLIRLGIADKITGYSYRKDNQVFLEEDCDATTFCVAYEERYKTPANEVIEDIHYRNSAPCRNYEGYQYGF